MGPFLAHNHLSRGELITFSLRGQRPRMTVVYDALFDHRMQLNDDETNNLLDKLPSRDYYVGLPFVTRLRRTNVNICHIMKLPKSLAMICGIEADEAGFVGVCLTTTGSVSTCAYVADTDDRIVLSAMGWRDFLVGKNLHDGQAIIGTIRKTTRHDLRMMIVIDII
ncbi:hypothetical protein VPH35_017081 [Triticum aestivum]